MSRPRDTYRQRCYNAERKVFGWYGIDDHYNLTLPDWDAIVKFARKVEQNSWWLDGDRRRSGPVYLVLRTKGANRSNASRGRHRVQIAPSQLRKDVIVHEYAHLLVPSHYAAHGAKWVACYLDGIKAMIGGEPAAAFAAELARTNVPGPKLPGYYR